MTASRTDSDRARQPGGPQRVQRLAIAAGLAIALVVAIVIIGQGGSGDEADLDSQAAEVEALFDGIPRAGTELGAADAELAMSEFADPQCPFCAAYARDVLPAIVERYVRPGDLRLELELLTFLGPESERAARVAIAAGEQGRAWEFVDLLYRALGTEGHGHLDDDAIREAAEATPGLDAERALREADRDSVTGRLAEAAERADELGVEATPSFFVIPARGEPRPIEVPALEPDAFTDQLDALVRGAAAG